MNLIMAMIVLTGSQLDPLLLRMESAEYITGSFTQTDLWALTLEEEYSEGILHLARPDLFLLDYTDPSGSAIGFDGSVLYEIDALARQAIVYNTDSQEGFLHMLQRCAEDSSVVSSETLGDSVMIVLQGDFGQGISGMEVGFTLSDSLPFFFSTTDSNGNTTSYTLGGLTVFASVPEGVFSMNVPPDYEIIDQQGI